MATAGVRNSHSVRPLVREQPVTGSGNAIRKRADCSARATTHQCSWPAGTLDLPHSIYGLRALTCASFTSSHYT